MCPILGEFGRLYAAQGEQEKARRVYGEARVIIRRLAESIVDEGVRGGGVTAVYPRHLLQNLDG